jgi:hypothetical protein
MFLPSYQREIEFEFRLSQDNSSLESLILAQD